MNAVETRNPSKNEIKFLLGTALGDSHFQQFGNAITMSFCHSVKQKDYLKWKYDNLPSFKKTKLKERLISYWYKNEKRKNINISFSILRHPILTTIFKMLIRSRRKVITRKYLNLLNPLSIAVWWCDDGSKWKNGVGALATQSFSPRENHVIKKWFRTVWGICSSVRYMKIKNKYLPYLFFSTLDLKRLSKLICNYVPECMRYKVYPISELLNVEYLPTKTLFKVVDKDIVQAISNNGST
jgi:hypothetical protein